MPTSHNCNGMGHPVTGNHCCYLGKDPNTGEQAVCGYLRIDDPRANGRKYTCGLFLDLKQQFPAYTIQEIWQHVRDNNNWKTKIKARLEGYGVTTPCWNWKGFHMPDGGCMGQCCFSGRFWGPNGNEGSQQVFENFYGFLVDPPENYTYDQDGNVIYDQDGKPVRPV